MYYTGKTEYQCFDVSGHYVGVAFDLWKVADIAGEGGIGVVERSVGETTYKVINGVAEATNPAATSPAQDSPAVLEELGQREPRLR